MIDSSGFITYTIEQLRELVTQAALLGYEGAKAGQGIEQVKLQMRECLDEGIERMRKRDSGDGSETDVDILR